ncbi:hypothetical protein M7I_7317 [Glarea lozoyensis 74030]|uniref:Uncharacterized protein n=1 Tax=Glarea lozoyensis (strain ATCC 74030 / MF5533) TaxID=1104152 RepID=H0EWZ2_GLAL7|nr:hypothetical protein M7I_7317 [Glarea lozoyensis 74030]
MSNYNDNENVATTTLLIPMARLATLALVVSDLLVGRLEAQV